MIKHVSRLGSVAAAVAYILGAAAVSGASAPVAADSPANNDDGAAAGSNASGSTTLEEIVVTAEKRSERAIDVPLSVSVINGADLATNGDVQLKDYFAQVPGLGLSARGSGRTYLVLRGITTGSSGNPTVGVTIDNSPFGTASGNAMMVPDIDPFDLDHIEVLSGPQGTLYGASSIGGLVKYVLAKPDTQSLSGKAEVDTSSTQHGGVGYGVRAAINLPASDNLAFRISGFKRQDAGYIQDTQQNVANVNEGHESGGRVAALWDVNDRVTVRASAMAQDADARATSDVDVDFNYKPLYGPYAHARLAGTDGFKSTIRFYDTVIKANLGWGDLESTSSYGQLRHEGPQDVTGTFGHLATLILGAQNPGVAIANNTRFNQFAQELRLSSPDDNRAFQWLYGLFYTNTDSQTYQQIQVVNLTTGVPLGLIPLYTGTTPVTYKEYAGFANFDYQFTHRFDVQVGGRYSENKQDFSSPTSGPLNGGSTNVSGNSSSSAVTYQVSPRFKITDDVLAYFRVATGYRPGGPNGRIPNLVIPTSYNADKTVNYELGLKGDFLDHKMTLESSVFYIDWNKIQITVTDQATGYSYYTNGGTAKSQGVESSLHWNPLTGLTVSGSVAYTDAKLTSNSPSGTGFSGDRLPYSSKESGSLAATQTFPISGQLTGFVGGLASYVGERLGNLAATPQTPRFRLPGYATADLRTGIEDQGWTVTLYLKNVADRMGYVNAQARNATTGISAYGVSLIQPRTVGLTVNKSW